MRPEHDHCVRCGCPARSIDRDAELAPSSTDRLKPSLRHRLSDRRHPLIGRNSGFDRVKDRPDRLARDGGSALLILGISLGALSVAIADKQAVASVLAFAGSQQRCWAYCYREFGLATAAPVAQFGVAPSRVPA